MKYAILYNPGHNRVYFDASRRLSIPEFTIVAETLSTQCTDVQQQNLSGISYLTFKTDNELSLSDIQTINGLSFLYALFLVKEMDGEIFLKPIANTAHAFVDESISTILKYSGKTNEIFTRMMINIAYAAQKNRKDIRLLDPIAGKGTTLYEGLIKGYNVYGIEIADTVVNEAYGFVKRFLETARYKFQHSAMKVSGPNKSFTAQRHTFETAPTKEDFKNKDTRTIELIAGDSLYANKYYKKNFFDIIVGDLPYGVQHGNVTNRKQSSRTRNPTELLRACLPSWLDVLKPGGTLVLSWNSNVLPREKMVQVFKDAGANILGDEEKLQFAHRVDQSIVRDLIVAQKLHG